ncbi:MAG: SRPBCC domain-containing protein [Betaproteobacteria bacterium]|nr:SRPBCC domain-containing protein [Betaproteobacteria bacterium]
MTMGSGDQAKAMVSVAVPIEEAFRIFTEEIELWWRRGPRFRSAPGTAGLICLEPKIDGRVFESFTDEFGETVVEIGRIKAWQPPTRLLLDWRNANFAPDEKTEVEVLFESSTTGTRVTVIHRGWRDIRADHPSRHGLPQAEFIRMVGMWWGDLLGNLRQKAAGTKF